MSKDATKLEFHTNTANKKLSIKTVIHSRIKQLHPRMRDLKGTILKAMFSETNSVRNADGRL